MRKKIAFYSHVIDFAGTWRSHERIIESLQFDDSFETFVLYCDNIENNRLETSKKILKNVKFVPFQRTEKKTGPETGYAPIETNFSSIAKSLDLDVLHFARSGYYEWPFIDRIAKVQIETNIFGYLDSSPFIDASIVIGRSLNIPENDRSFLIPNPIPPPTSNYQLSQSLRKELQIDESDLVFGRIGRPSNFTPISLEAFRMTLERVNAFYVIVGGCERAKEHARNLGIEDRVKFLDCTNDDSLIERFHKTIDVFAHYREDGEIHSTAISQAMIHGIPVITHLAGRNGQIEWLGDGGCWVRNSFEYSQAMLALADKNLRKSVGEAARRYATENFEQERIVEKIKSVYRRLLESS